MAAQTWSNQSFNKLIEYDQRNATHEATVFEHRASEEWFGIAFRVNDTYLLSEVEHIVEILHVPGYVTIPRAKPWILGLSSVRGSLLTLIDLGWFVSNTRTPITARTRVLSSQLHGKPIGLLVDEVYGQRAFAELSEQPALETDSPFHPFITHSATQADRQYYLFDLDGLYDNTEFLDGSIL